MPDIDIKKPKDVYGFEEPDLVLFELYGLVKEATKSIKKLNELIRLSGIRQATLSKTMMESDPNRGAEEAQAAKFARHSKIRAKHYIVVDPEGTVHNVYGLTKFIKEHRLNNRGMFTALRNNKPYKGWTVSNV